MHATVFFSILIVDCACNFYCLGFAINFFQIEPNPLDSDDKPHPGDKEHDVQLERYDSECISLGQKRRTPTLLLNIECCQCFCYL